MQAMLEQVNEKRIALNQQVSDTGKLVLKEKVEIKLNYIIYCSIKFYIAFFINQLIIYRLISSKTNRFNFIKLLSELSPTFKKANKHVTFLKARRLSD